MNRKEYWKPVFIRKEKTTKNYDQNGQLTSYSKTQGISGIKVLLYLFTFLWVPAVFWYIIKWNIAVVYNLYVWTYNKAHDNY